MEAIEPVDELRDIVLGAVLETWAPVENPEVRAAMEFATRVADTASPTLRAALYRDIDAPITEAEFELATALAARVGRRAERLLPLWLAAQGHDDRDASHAYFTGLDSDGEINLRYDGYESRDNRHYTLPASILLDQDYEAKARTIIAEREQAAAIAATTKEAKERAARERADRTTYERLRARFEAPRSGAEAFEGSAEMAGEAEPSTEGGDK